MAQTIVTYNPELRVMLSGRTTALTSGRLGGSVLGRYMIQSGDSLESIAQMFYGDKYAEFAELIRRHNNLFYTSLLPVGLVIDIPDLAWRKL